MSDSMPHAAAAGKCPFGHGAAPARVSIADALREETKAAHAKAEKHPMQGRMVGGEVSRAEYAAYLTQMLPVWTVLDKGLAAAAARDVRVGSMLQPYHAHAGRIAADLEFLGVTGPADDELGPQAAVPPHSLPATAAFVRMIEKLCEERSVGILGVWYVLEGSTNGGRFIAKAISRGLGIAGPEGLMFFDPHGQAQRERWAAWRAGLDALELTDAERAVITASAAATFEAVYDIMVDMERHAAVA